MTTLLLPDPSKPMLLRPSHKSIWPLKKSSVGFNLAAVALDTTNEDDVANNLWYAIARFVASFEMKDYYHKIMEARYGSRFFVAVIEYDAYTVAPYLLDGHTLKSDGTLYTRSLSDYAQGYTQDMSDSGLEFISGSGANYTWYANTYPSFSLNSVK